MISLKSAVYESPAMEKTGTFEVSKDSSKWNDEIMDQFFEQVPFIPKELGVDIVVNNVDDNEGYAKGSVVVWFNDKKINFPIIIKDYHLSPFDVFVYTDKDENTEYHPSTERNVKKILASDRMAKLENRYDNLVAQDLKTPGGIVPKQSIPLYDMPEGMLEPPYSKMSNWTLKARKEDIEKLAIQLEAQPGVLQSFVDNTGDLITNVINLQNNASVVGPDDHKSGPLDLNDVVKSKRAITLIDSQMFDVNKLTPILPPSVAELRKYSFPSMEDFIESGENASQRFLASRLGKPVVGIIVDMKTESDINFKYGRDDCMSCSPSYDEKGPDGKIIIRNRRPQVFISLDGGSYSTFDDWQKKGIGFYGSKMISVPGGVEKAVKMIAENGISDMFISINKANRDDKSDKLFNPIKEMDEGTGSYRHSFDSYRQSKTILVLYGAGDSWECVKICSNFRKIMVDNSPVYQSDNVVLIPARVASVQRVDSVKTPLYKMVVGKATNIYMIPETSVVLNGDMMEFINPDDFMHPDKTVQSQYEEAMIPKIAMVVDGPSGYRIFGKPIEPLFKLAGFNSNTVFDTTQTATILQTIGMEKIAAQEAMRVAIERYSSPEKYQDRSVTIYGVNGDYINYNAMEKTAKVERTRNILKQIAESIKSNFIKEASLLSDPTSVDVMLSLNFINEDNIMDYVESIGEMKKVIGKLTSMLIASRMGLADLDEDAIKKSMEGLQGVVDGLENVKLALGK